MLKKYEKTQEKAIKTLKNQLKSKKTSHAYLIVSENVLEAKQLIKEFIKELINADQHIIEKIDKEQLMDLKIIFHS